MRHLKNHVDSIGLADVSRFLDPLGPTTVTGNVASGLQTGQGLRMAKPSPWSFFKGLQGSCVCLAH